MFRKVWPGHRQLSSTSGPTGWSGPWSSIYCRIQGRRCLPLYGDARAPRRWFTLATWGPLLTCNALHHQRPAGCGQFYGILTLTAPGRDEVIICITEYPHSGQSNHNLCSTGSQQVGRYPTPWYRNSSLIVSRGRLLKTFAVSSDITSIQTIGSRAQTVKQPRQLLNNIMQYYLI